MEWVKAILRGTLKMGKWLLVATAVLFATLLAINSVDEDLKPEVATALEWPKIDVPEAENGYFALVGLIAPTGYDPHAWGKQWIAAQNAAKTREEASAAEKSLPGLKLKFIGGAWKNSPLCKFSNSDEPCLQTAEKNAAIIRKMATDNAELLARYDTLLAYAHIADVYRGVYRPFQEHSVPIHKLKLSLLALHLKDKQLDDALSELELDAAFQRKRLASAQELMEKMAATISLQQDYRMLSEILSIYGNTALPYRKTIERILVGLGKDELAIRPSLITEFRKSMGYYRRGRFNLSYIDEEKNLIELGFLDFLPTLFLKWNATANMLYATLMVGAALDDVHGAGFARQEETENTNISATNIGLLSLYNPGGKFMIFVSTVNFNSYARQLRGTEGLRRLIALQWLVMGSTTAPDQMPDLLEKAGSAYHDPFTDRPMQWDAQQHQIFFVTNSSPQLHGKDGRVAVKLGEAP